MKAPLTALAIIFIIGVSLSTGARPPQRPTPPPCTAIIEQALKDYAHIKVGVPRSEVERYFVRAAGAQFSDKTRYDYPKCPYIHVDVNFAATGSIGHFYSPNDKVTKVSTLYLGYQVRD